MTLWHRLNRALAPTEGASTAILWVLAILAVAFAVWGSPAGKAAVVAWMVLP